MTTPQTTSLALSKRIEAALKASGRDAMETCFGWAMVEGVWTPVPRIEPQVSAYLLHELLDVLRELGFKLTDAWGWRLVGAITSDNPTEELGVMVAMRLEQEAK